MSTQPRLVLVSNRRLDDVRSGSAAYLLTFIDAARQAGFEVQIVMAPNTAFGSRPWATISRAFSRVVSVNWPGSLRLGATYISIDASVWLRFLGRLGAEISRRIGATSASPTSLLSRVPAFRELETLAAIIRGFPHACVAVEYSSMAPLFRLLGDASAHIVLMHELFSSRAESFRAAGRPLDHADISLQEEVARLQGVDLVLHASMTELGLMKDLLPRARHVWMRPTTRSRRDALVERSPAALFVGADHAGNREAVEHLLADIWPRVRNRVPGARLVIAGSICERVRGVSPDVDTIGLVENLGDFAGPDRIGLAPIRVASGVAIKVVDYCGLGLPIIGYPGSLAGFGDLLDEVAIRVETPEAFADALVNLFEAPAERRSRSEAGLKLAETTLASSGVVEALGELRELPQIRV
jgi:hypothetical protein